MIERLPADSRRQIVKAAGQLYRSGAEPTPQGTPHTPNRAEMRQMARALGWRGAKAKRQNFAKRLPEVAKAVLVDEALGEAKFRAEHPILSRVGRRK